MLPSLVFFLEQYSKGVWSYNKTHWYWWRHRCCVFTKQGIDAVVWSRLYENAHQPDEWTTVENILGDAKVLATVMLEPR